MQLIGYFESPFVRRVAVTMLFYGMEFDHLPVATSDRARVEPHSPLGRIPALVLDGDAGDAGSDAGETLIDSTMIIDHLDQSVPPDRALTPREGPERRAVNRIVAVAMGSGDKYVAAYYETGKRPESHVWGPWLDRLEQQVGNGLRYLDDALGQARGGRYFVGDRLTQADISAAVVFDAIRFDMAHLAPDGAFPRLEALTSMLSETEPFRATRPGQPVP